jgi:hypothetical protein
VKDAQESSIVQFKNGKLLLKQKKIDFAQQSAALQSELLRTSLLLQSSLPTCTWYKKLVILTLFRACAAIERIEWNEYIDRIEEPLEKIPKKFHALVALMVHERCVEYRFHRVFGRQES